MLTLTPLGPDGNFNNSLITSLVNNEEAKSNLLSQLLAALQEKGFQGLDIDLNIFFRRTGFPLRILYRKPEPFFPPTDTMCLWRLRRKPPILRPGFSMPERTTGFSERLPTVCCS